MTFYANPNWRLSLSNKNQRKNELGNRNQDEQIFLENQPIMAQKEYENWTRDLPDMLSKITEIINSIKTLVYYTAGQSKFENETLVKLRELYVKCKQLHRHNNDELIFCYYNEKECLSEMFKLINNWNNNTNLAIWGTVFYNKNYPIHKSGALIDKFEVVTSHYYDYENMPQWKTYQLLNLIQD